MIASGPSTAIIHFDPRRLASLRDTEQSDLTYHMVRLLTGQRTAEVEWERHGIVVEVEPDSDGG